jgi:hypothetical protein
VIIILLWRKPKPLRKDPRAEFINASVWHGSLDRAQEILAARPEVARCDPHRRLLGDHEVVARFLADDAANAAAKGGPRNWDALTYLSSPSFSDSTPLAARAPRRGVERDSATRRLCPKRESLVRDFGYASGSAYGIFLVAWSPG